LTDALDELVSSGQVDPQLALKVLANFDKAITDELANNVKSRLTFKGNLNVYRSCDEVWTFILKNANFKFDNESVTADRIKIIACSSKKVGE
jgi:transcription initiation factor TFIIA small subunit